MSNRKLYKGKVFFTSGSDSCRKPDMLYLSECRYYNLRTRMFVFNESSTPYSENLTDFEKKHFEGGNHCYEPEIYRTSQDIANKIKGVVGELRSPLEVYALIDEEISMLGCDKRYAMLGCDKKRYAMRILKLENYYLNGVSVWGESKDSPYPIYVGEVYSSVYSVGRGKAVLIARTPEALVESLKRIFPNCIHDDLEDLDTSVTCSKYLPAVECLEDILNNTDKPFIFIKDYETGRSAWEALVDEEPPTEQTSPKFAVSVSTFNINVGTNQDIDIHYFNSLLSALGYFEYTLQSNNFKPNNLNYSDATTIKYSKPVNSSTCMKVKLCIEDNISLPQ